MRRTPCLWAISAILSKSKMIPPGLATPSQKINLTLSFIAFSKFSRLVGSTKLHFHPSFGKLTPNCVTEPPYKFREAMNSSPASIRVAAAINCAACPEEVATAPLPPSS